MYITNIDSLVFGVSANIYAVDDNNVNLSNSHVLLKYLEAKIDYMHNVSISYDKSRNVPFRYTQNGNKAGIIANQRFTAIYTFELGSYVVKAYKHSRATYLSIELHGLLQYTKDLKIKNSDFQDFAYKFLYTLLKMDDVISEIVLTRVDMCIDFFAPYSIVTNYLKSGSLKTMSEPYISETAYFDDGTGRKNTYINICCYNKMKKDSLQSDLTRLEFSFGKQNFKTAIHLFPANLGVIGILPANEFMEREFKKMLPKITKHFPQLKKEGIVLNLPTINKGDLIVA